MDMMEERGIAGHTAVQTREGHSRTSFGAANKLRHKNPVYPYYFADPFVWKHDDEYYAVGTGPIAEKETAEESDFSSFQMGDRHLAFPLLRSLDLVHWRLHGGAVDVSP